MTKKLNTADIQSQLEGSVFFPGRDASDQETTPTTQEQAPTEPPSKTQDAPDQQPKSDRAGKHASKIASELASEPPDTIEVIRKAVKHPGREVAFVRLTAQEKAALADVLYTYKRQGIKTSENELIRIGVGALLADYNDNGQISVLARVLEALQA